MVCKLFTACGLQLWTLPGRLTHRWLATLTEGLHTDEADLGLLQ
jgi:hypothetical protein